MTPLNERTRSGDHSRSGSDRNKDDHTNRTPFYCERDRQWKHDPNEVYTLNAREVKQNIDLPCLKTHRVPPCVLDEFLAVIAREDRAGFDAFMARLPEEYGAALEAIVAEMLADALGGRIDGRVGW